MKATIALGSNLDDPRKKITSAINEINNHPSITVLKTSSLYKTKPFGPIKQDDFINAVIQVETTLEPIELLHTLQEIENDHKRVRDERWGPRTLDLDILLYENLTIETPELTIPHPGLEERDFVIYPLAEIIPELVLPNGKAIQSLMCGEKPPVILTETV